jgi:hypothetical protein
MKSKFVMLIAVAAMAFSANSAMAAGKPAQSAVRGPKAITASSKIVKSGANVRAGSTALRGVSGTALPQPHTILNGAANNF